MRLTHIYHADTRAGVQARFQFAGSDGRYVTLQPALLGLGLPNAAELLVVDQLVDGWILPADRALRVLLQAQLTEPHAQRIEQQQSANQRHASTDDQLDGLVGLQRPDDAGQHAQHATLGARGDEPRRWRLAKEATVAGAFLCVEDRYLALESEDRAVHVGLA